MKDQFDFASADQHSRIFVKTWQPENPRGIVQLIHGMAEHINRYNEFAEFLASQGWMVIGDDHLGHGKTAGKDTLVTLLNTSQIVWSSKMN